MIGDALRSGRIVILSIDGGGVYGYAAAIVVRRLAQAMREPFPHKSFDLIAGTSAGALLGGGYAAGNAAWTGEQMTKVHAQVIFGRKARRFMGYVAGPKYSSDALVAAAKAVMHGRLMSEAAADLLIPVYRLDRGEPYFFKSWESVAEPAKDCAIAEAAAGSASAPVFFPPHAVTLRGGEIVHCWDGGLAANNPAACAIATADRMRIADVTLVSVGTGDKPNGIDPKAAARWGALQNVPRVISAALDGPNKAVDYQMRQRFAAEPIGRYFRFEGPLSEECGPMDDASPKNLARIRDYAEDLCNANRDAIAACAETIREKKS